MKGERVREGKTGKRWKGRSEMGTKHQVDRFRILKTLRGQEEIEKAKSREIQEWGDPWHFHGHCQLLASKWPMTQFSLFRRGRSPWND